VESNRHLVERGVEVHVFAPSYEGLSDHVVHGVPVHRFRYFPRRFEHLTHMQGAPNRLRNPLYLFVAVFYVLAGLIGAIRLCRRERFDVLHVHWPFPHGIWGYVAGRLTRTPVVLTFHGAEILLCRRFPFVRPFLAHATRHAQAILTNSTYTQRKVSEITSKASQVLPFGCTVDARPPSARPEKGVKQILFAGRLIERKGLDQLLAALPLLEGRTNFHLHVVGDGDMSRAWRRRVHEMGLDERVSFHGFVSNEELERRYREADVFVLPAIVDERGDTEGLGVVLVEALSSGTPVVASDVGGIPDVVRDMETGLLVPQKDPAALAAAILRLLEDPALARRLTEAGLQHARSYFDWDRITRSLLEVYERVTTSHAGESLECSTRGGGG
jgi:glycosyltransferase involved in cell wall biosynthesis